jgi:hypothetical protein
MALGKRYKFQMDQRANERLEARMQRAREKEIDLD